MMSRLFAGTVADHLEVNDQTVGDTDRGDVKGLPPLAAVLGAFFEGDLSCEFHNISNLQVNRNVSHFSDISESKSTLLFWHKA